MPLTSPQVEGRCFLIAPSLMGQALALRPPGLWLSDCTAKLMQPDKASAARSDGAAPPPDLLLAASVGSASPHQPSTAVSCLVLSVMNGIRDGADPLLAVRIHLHSVQELESLLASRPVLCFVRTLFTHMSTLLRST